MEPSILELMGGILSGSTEKGQPGVEWVRNIRVYYIWRSCSLDFEITSKPFESDDGCHNETRDAKQLEETRNNMLSDGKL